jgi:hypothetical protein
MEGAWRSHGGHVGRMEVARLSAEIPFLILAGNAFDAVYAGILSCPRQLATAIAMSRPYSRATSRPLPYERTATSSSHALTSASVAGRPAGHLAGLVGCRPGSVAAAASSSHRPVSPSGLIRRPACTFDASAAATIATAS